jgi:hypothetical protein
MADRGIGDPSDTKATNTTGEWSLVSLVKKLIDSVAASASGDATAANQATQITAEQAIQASVALAATSAKQDTQTTALGTLLTTSDFDTKTGALTETAPANDTASSGVNGRLQRIAQRLTTLLAVFPTTIDTNSGAKSASTLRTVHATDDTMIGALTETAPANDTASSGLNGRLQRIAQNITTLISSSLIAVGNVASAASDSGNPVKTGGKYNSTKPTLTNGQRGDTQVEINGATAVSLYAQSTNPGDTPVTANNTDSVTGALKVQPISSSGFRLATTNDTAEGNNGSRVQAVHHHGFNGSTWDRLRAMVASTVLASAARTGTVSTDITNFNGKTIAVTLNITVAPNTASTITLQIRLKDSISGNYTILLASAAIVGTATTGVVPVTNLYRVGQGITVTANVSAADVLGRTLNVNMVHSDSASWTYSVSADIGL